MPRPWPTSRTTIPSISATSDAAIAISLLAIASLTQLWWLYFLSLVPAGFGLVMGVAGLAGWDVHPTALVKLLS